MSGGTLGREPEISIEEWNQCSRSRSGFSSLAKTVAMGCPGATIVFEELIQLGCKKLIRVGTCGGLQPSHALGDLVVTGPTMTNVNDFRAILII